MPFTCDVAICGRLSRITRSFSNNQMELGYFVVLARLTYTILMDLVTLKVFPGSRSHLAGALLPCVVAVSRFEIWKARSTMCLLCNGMSTMCSLWRERKRTRKFEKINKSSRKIPSHRIIAVP